MSYQDSDIGSVNHTVHDVSQIQTTMLADCAKLCMQTAYCAIFSVQLTSATGNCFLSTVTANSIVSRNGYSAGRLGPHLGNQYVQFTGPSIVVHWLKVTNSQDRATHRVRYVSLGEVCYVQYADMELVGGVRLTSFDKKITWNPEKGYKNEKMIVKHRKSSELKIGKNRFLI